MSLEKANISWNAKQISAMYVNGRINCDHIVQRGCVWDKRRKSEFIESMIIGYPIPSIWAKRVGDINTYFILDGKQRITTIKQYLNNEFALSNLNVVEYYDVNSDELKKEDISNKKYSELSDDLKEIINTTAINVIYFDNLTAIEEKEMFRRLNNGKPLSVKSKILSSCKNLDLLIGIGDNRLFDEMLTSNAKDNKNQVTLVVKTWLMLNKDVDEISFENKALSPIVADLDVTDKEEELINNVFDYIYDTHYMIQVHFGQQKIAKKLYTETHFASIIPLVKKCLDNNYESSVFADFVMEFYGSVDGASISEEYNLACESGIAKNVNIVKRNNALVKYFDEFVSKMGE